MDYDLTSAFVNLLVAACGFWVIVVIVMLVVFALSRFLNQTVGAVFYGGDDE